MTERTFRYRMSPRCFRYREDSILSHAPQAPGVFELVTFDENQRAQILYVGLAARSIAADLTEHWSGARPPSVKELLARYPNLYFDYVDWSDAKDLEDLKDIAAALAREHHPSHNPEPLTASGRYEKVVLKEVEIPLHSPTSLL
jgi:hypothetical protein